jgi:hypothetical protein
MPEKNYRLTPEEFTALMMTEKAIFPPNVSVDTSGKIIWLARRIAEAASEKARSVIFKEMEGGK